ncbi:Alpha/Beta hydrolase protein [Protomyces lactucae-debilis]|uniref:Carboxypeptidase n=1 Tax=Protomyces lactucae-debilis TaxID=2754530 RepID=A0A1Y2FSZ7_PROLT|nr:Alpha/Beta hydrolase protein [Protomyces lactucae-debilis]ORY87131.1 Alpha/Beta hydrolase protein [Protomyces lactucae-debilis]
MLQALSLLLSSAWAFSREQFTVNGTAIPDVDFDVGPSFAGLLPVSQISGESRQLFFWYFPSKENHALTIFLNGGPGCSSLEGVLQENGPIMYRKGMLKPERNPNSWTQYTSMLYIEQPVGTGFSQGVANADNEETLAAQFYGFLQQFRDVFPEVKPQPLFLTGESYAGKYIPYIGKKMLDDGNKVRLTGVMLIDPVLTSMTLQEEVPSAAFMQRNKAVLGLDDSTMREIQQISDDCGYTFLIQSQLPGPTSIGSSDLTDQRFNTTQACSGLWQRLVDECTRKNPNFDIYKVTDSSLPYDPMGFPASQEYLPPGGQLYFNRTDVQMAINAPPTSWTTCARSPVFPNGDTSPNVVKQVLPNLIEQIGRVIVVHGMLDLVLIEEGTRLALQSMTFNNARGFNQGIMKPFSVEGKGQTGHYVQERGLSYVQLKLAGHQVPEDDGSSGIKLLQVLLGEASLG